MKESYIDYYRHYTLKAPLVFLFDIMRQKSTLRKLALKNRLSDYSSLGRDPALMVLHERINRVLLDASKDWPHYDYGEGYFYQSYRPAQITGFRDTAGRIAAMNLRELVKGKDVLDIGCNSGFVALAISQDAKSVTGMDINPYHVQIGLLVRDHFKIKNVELSAAPFENWSESSRYDVVMSFANHSTFDQQTKQDLESYFEKCGRVLKEGGELLVESHAPGFEGEKFRHVVEIIEQRFKMTESRVLDYGGFLDKGRTFIRAIAR